MCQPCGDCSFCLRAKSAVALLRNLEALAYDLQDQINTDMGGEPLSGHPIYKHKQEKVDRAMKLIRRIREEL
jgi:hypothetical protein